MGELLKDTPEIFISSGDGVFVPISKIQKAEIDENIDCLYPAYTQSGEFCFSFSVSVETRMGNGAKDYICGINSPAARRFIRHDKRMKEKKRRNRLKSGIR